MIMKFSGFDDWIPVFRGGKQIDSTGKEHDGNALIDKAVAGFSAAAHEPPACIGHPKEDAPAYGWVEGLKKQGNLLMAKFKQVQPQFAQMVQDGLFKKRSAAFYPDGTLRHVGFLGAMPPAVKGLPDVAFVEFAEGDVTSFEFSDYQTVWAWESIARMFGRMRDYLIEKEGAEKADQVISSYNIEEITTAAAQEKQEIGNKQDSELITQYKEKEDKDMTFKQKLAAFFSEFMAKMPDDGPAAAQTQASGGQFTEADLEKVRIEVATKEREKVTLEFAESAKKTRLAGLKGEIAVFCEALVKAGKITPATIAFGLPEILFSMAESDNQIEFGETKEKATTFDRMKALLESATPLVTFGEIASRTKDAGATGNAGAKLDTLTQKKMKEQKDLTYSAAFTEVQKEYPDLAKEYAAEFQSEA
jgi:hypothetical protein